MSIMSSAAKNSRHCNVNHLLQSLAGDRMAVRNLAQMFLDMYPGKIALIDAAMQNENWVALRRVVHDLRGSCAIFSATTCLALAGKLENRLPDHVDLELYEDCARFKTALINVAVELRLFLDDRPESCQ